MYLGRPKQVQILRSLEVYDSKVERAKNLVPVLSAFLPVHTATDTHPTSPSCAPTLSHIFANAVKQNANEAHISVKRQLHTGGCAHIRERTLIDHNIRGEQGAPPVSNQCETQTRRDSRRTTNVQRSDNVLRTGEGPQNSGEAWGGITHRHRETHRDGNTRRDADRQTTFDAQRGRNGQVKKDQHFTPRRLVAREREKSEGAGVGDSHERTGRLLQGDWGRPVNSRLEEKMVFARETRREEPNKRNSSSFTFQANWRRDTERWRREQRTLRDEENEEVRRWRCFFEDESDTTEQVAKSRTQSEIRRRGSEHKPAQGRQDQGRHDDDRKVEGSDEREEANDLCKQPRFGYRQVCVIKPLRNTPSLAKPSLRPTPSVPRNLAGENPIHQSPSTRLYKLRVLKCKNRGASVRLRM